MLCTLAHMRRGLSRVFCCPDFLDPHRIDPADHGKGCGSPNRHGDDDGIQCRVTPRFELLDHLELRQPNIVGFSLGGAVALEMALQRPQSVPRLALINSLARIFGTNALTHGLPECPGADSSAESE